LEGFIAESLESKVESQKPTANSQQPKTTQIPSLSVFTPLRPSALLLKP